MNIPLINRSDSMAFLALQGQPPIFNKNTHPQISLAHVTSVPPFVKDFDAALAAHEIFKKQALANPDVHHVRVRYDLERKESLGLIFGMQHTPEHMTWTRMRKLQYAGVKVMSLAYDGPTEYGDGFLGSNGLTPRGRNLLLWMGSSGIILDLSHANALTARDALEFIEREQLPLRVMASHSGCYSACPHPRNLSDDIIQRLQERNGYLGVYAITFYLTWKGDAYLEAMAHHILRALVVGNRSPTFIGIGSDCPHIGMTMEQAQANFDRMVEMLKTNGAFGEYFPDRPPEVITGGAKMFDVLEHGLYASIRNDALMRGIMGENFKAFIERSLPR